MPWVYLDDQFPEHPKVLAAGGDAAWLYVCALAYCNRNLTEGEIPKVAVPRLSDRKRVSSCAKKLVEVGLWEDKGDHFYVHDYHEWNRSALDERSKKIARSEAARRAAEARWAKRPPDGEPPGQGIHPDPDHPPGGGADANAAAMPPHMPTDSGRHAEAGAVALPPHSGSQGGSQCDRDAPARGRAPSPSPPHSSDSRLVVTNVGRGSPGSESGDFNEATLGLATWFVEGMDQTGWSERRRAKVLDEVRRVVSHCQAFLDDQPIEEAIGRCRELDQRPTTAKYLLTTVRRWAAEGGIEIPELGPESGS